MDFGILFHWYQDNDIFLNYNVSSTFMRAFFPSLIFVFGVVLEKIFLINILVWITGITRWKYPSEIFEEKLLFWAFYLIEVDTSEAKFFFSWLYYVLKVQYCIISLMVRMKCDFKECILFMFSFKNFCVAVQQYSF